MNDHTKCLVSQIYNAFLNYERNLIDEYGLLLNIEGNIGAIEEADVMNQLQSIANAVDEARWIYTQENARVRILQLFEKVRVLKELG